MSEKKILLLKINDYEVKEVIRNLTLGRIKLAKNKRTNELIALKILDKSQILKTNRIQHISNELKILPILDHPSIISFLGANHDEKYIYLAFEFLPGGDLFSLLKLENKLSTEKAQFYAGQIVFVIDYLHSKNIVYRALKPENILINKNGYLKIFDFGFSKEIKDRTYTMCGTPEYLAPEIILNKGYGLSVDWWAFGVLLYEMICGVDPFTDDDTMKIYENILQRKIQFTSDFDDSSRSLIKHLLEPELSKRYGNLKNGVKDIKTHPFFKGMNWEKLLKQEVEAPFIPEIKEDNVLKYYTTSPEIEDKAEPISKDDDPFKDLFN
jgi:serine/threonine protein kinase